MERFLCKFLGLHKYVVLEKVPYSDVKEHVIGFVVVSRCTICGRIKRTTIIQEERGR